VARDCHHLSHWRAAPLTGHGKCGKFICISTMIKDGQASEPDARPFCGGPEPEYPGSPRKNDTTSARARPSGAHRKIGCGNSTKTTVSRRHIGQRIVERGAIRNQPPGTHARQTLNSGLPQQKIESAAAAGCGSPIRIRDARQWVNAGRHRRFHDMLASMSPDFNCLERFHGPRAHQFVAAP